MALCSMTVAAGLVGLVVMAKILRRMVWLRRGGAFGGGPLAFAFAGGPCGGDGRFGGGVGLGRSRWMRALFHRLDTTPGQEREIRAAIEDLVDRVRDAGAQARRTRENLARAVASPAFDEGAYEATSARLDATATQAKDAMRGALVRIHGVLDDRQRARLASLLEHGFWGARRGPGRGGAAEVPGAGPYRSSPESSEDKSSD